MKYLKIFSITFILIFSCTTSNDKLSILATPKELKLVDKKTDTIVSVIPIFETEKEYFVIINNDTSLNSIFINSNSKERLTAKFSKGSNKKISTELFADSSAISFNMEDLNEYHSISYNEQMNNIKLLLCEISKEVELKGMVSFSFSMTDIPSFSEDISRLYFSKNGIKLIPQKNTEIIDMIKESNFFQDMNLILSQHKIMVDKVFIDGLAIIKPCNVCSNLFDGVVILTIKTIN